jgi:hypothetical protein
MRNRSQSPKKQQQKMTIDYTEVPMGATETDSTPSNDGVFPSSFRKQESVKTLFPWMRSYMFRRRLSFAAVGAAFIVVGSAVTFVMMKRHDNVPNLGEFRAVHYNTFSF